MAKRYYWLKLPEDFFRQKAIKKLRRIAGGDTYTIIYLKMLLIAIKQDGKLYFDGVEDNFIDELALDLDEAPDDVQMTVQFLQNQGLMQLVNGTEYELEDCCRMTGSESSSAERMRRYRGLQASQCDTNVTASDDPVTPPLHLSDVEIEKEKELDKEIEKDKTSCPEPCEKASSEPEPEPFITLPLNTGEEYPVFQSEIDEFTELYPAVDVPQAMRDMRGWLLTNPTRRKTKRGIRKFENSWLAKEQDKGRPQGASKPVKKNSFNDFPQREYDGEELERYLLRRQMEGENE